MRRGTITAVLVALAWCLAAAGPRQDAASKVAELRGQAEKAKDEDKGKLLAELVRYEVEVATQQFNGGNAQQGLATLKQIEDDVRQCEAAAMKTGKNLKRTDIDLREAGRRLDDLRRTIDFENQIAVKRASDTIDEARNSILNRMFGAKEKK